MRKPWILFRWIMFQSLWALLFGCGGATQTEPASVAPTATETPPEQTDDAIQEVANNAFIWKATSDSSSKKTIYLLGSVHAGKPDFYPLDPVIEDAYAESEVLVVEVNLAAVPKKKMAQIVLARAMLPKDQTLEKNLEEQTWSKLALILEKHHVPAASIARFKPWFAAVTLVTLRIAKSGYNLSLGIDQYFMKKGDKQIIQLESADSQLALLDEMPGEIQNLMLLDAIEGSLQSGGDLEQIMAAWQDGNAEALGKIVFSELKERPEFEPLYKRMLTDRNHTMAKRIEEIAKERSNLFVVVGAAHLVGDDGLVAIFERKGYSLQQLENQER
ncbi:MAG: TraB/GumN family protein [Deltaproteobacteria bacterium]|nr:TraB/GumN family protein [Deltaproteobacteria bacterium]